MGQTETARRSKRVENNDVVLLDLIATVTGIAVGDNVCCATDLKSGGTTLLITLFAAHSPQLLYVPGRIVHHAAATYRGDGKIDTKDVPDITDRAAAATC
ncbi:hypothetical protein MTX36_19900 [Rhodococcus sp. ARC_M6]|nr:hypothetical protein [Rhodococcus sp. ARC_M6]